MDRGSTTARKGLNRFFRDNWFKLLLVLVALYIFFQKDLSFQVQFRSPVHPDTEEESPARVDRAEKREKLTVRNEGEKKDLFNLSSALSPPRKGPALATMLDEVSEETKLAYLKRFARVALVEQKKFGIPASITLSNALLQSTSGKADWAETGNNHFGILCTDGWTGESGTYNGRCYRHYTSAWESFRDHSLFLSKDWRDSLPFGKNANYKTWASALAKGPYGHENGMESQLIRLVEIYRLDELDALPQ
ncbi:MAG: glucosaminidase domain-containing protein [Lewinellaceae bacterium]|nr:glucosaminidase domain-containing protein [Lewinellaceae bacterium]